jgi:hypothetical protein
LNERTSFHFCPLHIFARYIFRMPPIQIFCDKNFAARQFVIIKFGDF